MKRHEFWLAALGGAMLALGPPAHAQRAAENAVTSAQDGFGNTVGNESNGLYSATDVRGFSPTEAGVFEVKRPFFNLSTANVFARVGDVRHRGVELSVTGQPMSALTVVAGLVLLQARISGETVTSGRSGRVPLGCTPRVARLNMQYGPASWDGLSLEGQIENAAGRYANIANTLRTEGYTTINLGGRYRFNFGDTAATLREPVLNASNIFTWVVAPTGTFSTNEQRRLQISLAADF